MFSELEFWHFALAGGSLLVTIGAKWVASGFQAWAHTLRDFRSAVSEELTSLKTDIKDSMAELKHDMGAQMDGLEDKFQRHEDRMRDLTLHMERRVTRIETQIEVTPHRPFVQQSSGREL